ncbi:hypothetical protein TrRE_jg11008 [Triparma retinervis]|uniref:Nucleolar complex-associated protein 3 N-terminal domain-containing protein n=1 Tax=Triparma retinervis TaxID=2557542 RepID=A0A9W7G823_9STRA|nr:hypothetical protein TrRE_jg11008 [Triparma retinervis]
MSKATKTTIATLSQSIITNPTGGLAPTESGPSQLSQLTSLIGHPLLGELAMKSLTLLYCDILPSYRLRQHSSNEQVKKEERKTRVFENRLLSAFTAFVGLLRRDPSRCSTRCLVELVRAKEGGNFYGQMVQTLVRRSVGHGEIVAGGLGEIVERDRRWQASSVIIGEVAKHCNKGWKDGVKRSPATDASMRSLILAVTRVNLRVTKEEVEAAKLLGRSNKKNGKKDALKKEVEDEMVEGDARESKSNIIRWQGDALDSLVRCYLQGMRVGVEESDEALVDVVMKGIGKFGELVNSDVVVEVVRVCKRLLTSEKVLMSTSSSLSCVLCVYSLLSHNLEETGKDDMWVLTALYKQMGRVGGAGGTLLQCVDRAVFKRREIRVTTVGALVKRALAIGAGTSDGKTQAVMLGTARMIIARYKSAERGTEEEEGAGEEYDGVVDDPEFSNVYGEGGAYWEFANLRFSHIDEVRKSALDGANLRRMDATSDPKKALVKWEGRERDFRYKMREPRKHPLERKGVGVGSGKRRKIMKDVFVKVKEGKGTVKGVGRVVV